MKSLDLADLLGLPTLPGYLDAVQAELRAATYTDNSHIQQPIDRLLQAGGKRLRPSLLIAAVASQERKVDQAVISACSSIELVHMASLVHDDIIDRATTRHNIPTINSQEGIGSAIIIGDYLLAKANFQAAAVSADVAQVVASTIAALCDGQSRELATPYNQDQTLDDLRLAIQGKTASLFKAACEIGGLCAGLSKTQVTALADFGQQFGMAFQLVDDVLDFLSSAELLGKPAGSDVVEGVYTMPLLLSLQGPQAPTVKTLLGKKPKTAKLIKVLGEDGSFNKTIQAAQYHNQAASAAIGGFSASPALRRLQHFPSAYLDWALQHLIIPMHRPLVISERRSQKKT